MLILGLMPTFLAVAGVGVGTQMERIQRVLQALHALDEAAAPYAIAIHAIPRVIAS